MSTRLVIASGNAHKISELRAMLGAANLGMVEVRGVGDLGEPPQVEETGADFAANARLKAAGVQRWLAGLPGTAGDLVLADDSGICVDALDGAPGVHSARFAGSDGATDAENNRKLVSELRTRGCHRSPAHYAVVLVLARVGEPLVLPPQASAGLVGGMLYLEGRCEGEVRAEARGEGGFGYDPHFWIDGGAGTFAELSREQKAQRSHRGEATGKLVHLLRALLP